MFWNTAPGALSRLMDCKQGRPLLLGRRALVTASGASGLGPAPGPSAGLRVRPGPAFGILQAPRRETPPSGCGGLLLGLRGRGARSAGIGSHAHLWAACLCNRKAWWHFPGTPARGLATRGRVSQLQTVADCRNRPHGRPREPRAGEVPRLRRRCRESAFCAVSVPRGNPVVSLGWGRPQRCRATSTRPGGAELWQRGNRGPGGGVSAWDFQF